MRETYSQGADAFIGERLRGAREQAGISMEQLIAATRISRTYLEAIEEGHFERLPGHAYVSGFIRLYATQVGLDADSVMEEYRQVSQPAARADLPRQSRRLSAFSVDGRRRWGVTGILLLSVLVASFLTDSDREPRPSVVPVRGAAPASHQQLSSVHAAASTSPHLVPPPAAPDTELPPAAVPEPGAPGSGIFLRIKADRECWLNIDIDGEMARQYTLRAGDVIEWKGERRFSLDIGNAGGILVEFNGKSLGPLGKEGAPVHLELTRDGSE